MVGPSITETDRKRLITRLKLGFALLVGFSMGLVTLYSGASLLTAAGVTTATTAVGGVLAWYTFPDSIAETPYDTRERGPKPGQRMRERRSESEEDRSQAHATDGHGQSARRERD